MLANAFSCVTSCKYCHKCLSEEYEIAAVIDPLSHRFLCEGILQISAAAEIISDKLGVTLANKIWGVICFRWTLKLERSFQGQVF